MPVWLRILITLPGVAYAVRLHRLPPSAWLVPGWGWQWRRRDPIRALFFFPDGSGRRYTRAFFHARTVLGLLVLWFVIPNRWE